MKKQELVEQISNIHDFINGIDIQSFVGWKI